MKIQKNKIMYCKGVAIMLLLYRGLKTSKIENRKIEKKGRPSEGCKV